MKRLILISALLVTAFAFGMNIGARYLCGDKQIQLHVESDRRSGIVTAYTFYLDKKGKEIMHGDYYEFTINGRTDMRRRYEDGRIVDGRAIMRTE